MDSAQGRGSAKPWRKTPLLESASLSAAAGWQVYMKLDNLQPSGSFKSRGVGNFLLAHMARPPTPPATLDAGSPGAPAREGSDGVPATHFYCSSGGNAGLACATAAAELRRPCTVVVPESTKPMMIDKIRAAGASDVVVHGASWQEADTFLRKVLLAKDLGGVYVPPFDHPDVWAGNATLVEEVAVQLAERRTGCDGHARAVTEPPDAIICSVGGGGLLNGIVQGKMSRALSLDGGGPGWSDTPVIAVETIGADSLAVSLAAGRLVTLAAITSAATSLGARRVSEQSFRLASDPSTKVSSLVLPDAEAARACVRFADEERIMVELGCGVSLAVLYEHPDRLEQILRRHGRWKGPETTVVVEVCGGSIVTSEMLEAWRAEGV